MYHSVVPALHPHLIPFRTIAKSRGGQKDKKTRGQQDLSICPHKNVLLGVVLNQNMKKQENKGTNVVFLFSRAKSQKNK